MQLAVIPPRNFSVYLSTSFLMCESKWEHIFLVLICSYPPLSSLSLSFSFFVFFLYFSILQKKMESLGVKSDPLAPQKQDDGEM